MAMNIGSGIAVGMVNFILPLFALSLNATTTEIGLIKGMMGVGDILIVLPAGFLIDHFGSKKMYTLACLTGAGMILIIATAGSPYILLWIMVFYGISRSLRTTSLNASFFRNMNTIGIKKGGWFKGAMTIGAAFIGPLIGGIAILCLGFSGYFIFASAFLLVPLFILYYRSGSDNLSPASFQTSGISGSLVYYRKLLENRLLVSATLTECMNTAFFMTFSTFITVLIVKDFGLSPGIAAILISIRGAAQILVVFFCGRLLYGNHNRMYMLSYGMTILGLLLFGTSGSIAVLAVAAVLIGAFSGLMTTLTFTNVGSIEGERGKIAGIFAIGTSIGAIFGPVYGGFIGDAFTVQDIFLAFIPLFAVMAVFYFVESRRIPMSVAG
jgi:MFS family permease